MSGAVEIGAAPPVAPDDARAELSGIMAQGSPYWSPLHPGHKAAVERATALHARLADGAPSPAPSVAPNATPVALNPVLHRHLEPGDAAHLEAVELAKQRDVFPPWDPRHKALHQAQTEVVARAAAAQEAAERARAAAAEHAPPIGTAYPFERTAATDIAGAIGVGLEEVQRFVEPGVGFLRALDVPAMEAGAIMHDVQAVLSQRRGGVTAEEQTARAGEKLRSAWGRDYQANMAAVQSLIAATPGLGKWLEDTGAGNSLRVASALLGAARRRVR